MNCPKGSQRHLMSHILYCLLHRKEKRGLTIHCQETINYLCSMKQFILFLTILFIASNTKAQNLVINELMQSNIECIMDDIKEFPDSWV